MCIFHLLSNSRNNSSPRIQYALSLDLVPRLLSLLSTANDAGRSEIQQDCLCILINIAADSDYSINKLLEYKPVPILLKVPCVLFVGTM